MIGNRILLFQTDGGVIILGVIENKDGTWSYFRIRCYSCQKLIKQFWNDINNRQKVSINLLRDDDVEVYKKKMIKLL